ncbi:MAG: molybdopterin molybdotransferase MoeA [Desulfobulbaceae bacterium]|nr:molybdopterin molybdotransferase MoeA [Desulfobulbaceae bacterium]
MTCTRSAGETINAMPPLTLSAAQKLILSQVTTLAAENIPLSKANNRVAAAALTAPSSVPAFPRSAMDGFAVNSRDLKKSREEVRLAIIGEVAAGCTELPRLSRGAAIRIMTGGAIPPGADQVVQVERCKSDRHQAMISLAPKPGAFIRHRGADLKKGQTIVRAGAPIAPQHLALLAESGINSLAAVRRPNMAILCTGSELLETNATPETGQIIGGNRYLLAALAKDAGARPQDMGLVADKLEKIVNSLKDILQGPADIIITTGGMGPGKYDLLPQAFAQIGIKTLYHDLAVRPGRSTMFGIYGNKAVFALPGPPPAVFLLFHELVKPALKKMQGCATPLSAVRRAMLTEEIVIKKKGVMNLKGAVAKIAGQKLMVRPARNLEPANSIIHIPAHRRGLAPSSMVNLRLLAPL